MSAEHEVGYSYFRKEFVAFYDQMVLQCFGGTSAPDVQAYSSLLQQQLDAAAAAAEGRDVVAVDLGCGSGRAILTFLEHLAHIEQPPCKVHLWGVDNSPVFLEAAQAKCSTFLDQHPTLKSWISLNWTLGSFESWELPQQQHQHTKADLILVAGAGLHHVASTAGMRTALQLMAQRLAPQGLCVVSYLPWAELYRQDSLVGNTAGTTGGPVDDGPDKTAPGSSSTSSKGPDDVLAAEEFRVQGYKRVLLAREVKNEADGSCVLHERFALSKLTGDDEAREEWCIEEGWQLRRLEREELLAVAADAGLSPEPAACIDDGGCGTARALSGGSAAGGDGMVAPNEHGSHFIVFKHRL